MITGRRVLVSVAGLALAAAAGLAWWFGWPAPAAPPETEWPVTTRILAGTGQRGGTDGPAYRATFSDPYGVAMAGDGSVIVSDGMAHRIRRIDPAGVVTTIAGRDAGFADGPGHAARFDTPSGIAIGPDGAVYVADTANNAVRRVTLAGVVTTIAGDGIAGFRDGPGSSARFNGPVGLAVDPAGRLIVADTYNDRIRAISPDGTVTTVAGDGTPGRLDGVVGLARFDTPAAVTTDAAGTIIVADTGNDSIRVVTPAGVVETMPMSLADPLVRPQGVAHTADGVLYVTDDRGRVIERRRDGYARVLAGSVPGFAPGDGRSAQFRQPAGIAVLGPQHLVVADNGNGLIRRVLRRPDAPLAPDSPLVHPRFDLAAFAHAALLWPVDPLEGPHEVAGTIGEARGSAGSERFHAGVDIRAERGTTVRAVRPGAVSAVIATGDFGSLNEWVRLGPVGYVHVSVGRDGRTAYDDPQRLVPTFGDDGRLVRVRIKRGARFATGDPLGTVNAFNHVHLNVGGNGEEYNPLGVGLVQFSDSVRPTIARNGILIYDEAGQRLTARASGRLLVSGRVRIVVDAWDQADGNRPERRLGLYEVGYVVLRADQTPVPGYEATRVTLRFDRLSQAPETARLVYAEGSGIPFYGRRTTRFLYNVTNALIDGVAAAQMLDTTLLEPGDYVIRIRAADIAGNEALANRDLPIAVVRASAP